MNNIFCTLFDSNYLDKGLVLYDSMCKHMSQFKLYVFACDKKCYEILKVEKSNNLIPIDIFNALSGVVEQASNLQRSHLLFRH